jgi:putative ABC transport system permease protein
MKKTNFIDLLRFIKKTLVSFLSIGIFMGVSFGVFLGIFSSAQSMRNATDNYFVSHDYSDIQIASSLGFTEEDVAKLKELDCVADAQGSKETFAWTEFMNGRYLTYFMEYSEQLNQYELIDGRMPQKADECAIDYSLNYHDGLQIGDTIDVTPFEDQATGLVCSKLTITGYVTHPYALSKDKENRRGFAPYGDGSVYCFILLNSDAFDADLYQDSYPTVYVSVKDADQYSSFTKKYKNLVADAKQEIESLGEDRSDIRYNELHEQASDAVEQVKDSIKAYGESEESTAMLEEAQQQLDNISPSSWTLLDRYTNTSFLEIDAFATSLTNISWSFSIIFIIVSVIIIYTMLSRLIDEQRLYTGIKKSVGFKTKEILSFFLLYSTLSSIIGVFIGLPLNSFIEELAYDSYAGRFWFIPEQEELCFMPNWALGVYGALFLIALLSTVFAVYSSVVERPTDLLRGEKPPRDTAKILKRVIPNWKNLSTFSKMIYCNIFSNAKRLVSVIAGIAGSLALLLIGILVHSDIVRVPMEQAKITLYDQLIVCDDTGEVQNILDNTAGVTYLNTKEINCAFQAEDLMGAATLVCLSPGYEDFINVKDAAGKTIGIPSDSALISTKIADINNLKIGSELKLSCSGSKEITVKVGGIIQNYEYNTVIISPEYYQQIFDSEPDMNQFYVTYAGSVSIEQQNQMIDRIKTADGFLAVKNANRFDDYFISMAENLMAVLMILIILAAFLVAVVIYNTVVMNIIRRKAELAMLMINGFSIKEIKRYISREFWSMAIVGMIFGTVLGCILSVEVDKVVEPVYCQFVRTPSVLACVQAVGVALALAIILNLLAMRILRKIKISDTMR